MSRMKSIRYGFEAAGALLTFAFLRVLPLAAASALGGWLGRTVGPRTRVHSVAADNLRRAMPELPDDRRQTVLRGMWENLGRVLCEYPHLPRPGMLRRVKAVHQLDYLLQAMRSGRPVLCISAHLGNWELLPLVSAALGYKQHMLYRPANNPWVDRLLARIREPYSLGLHAKGMQSARAVTHAMKQGEPVCMLVDQKTSDGLPIPFFGANAMTTTAVAQFVLKYNPIIVPAYCRRLRGTNYEICVEPPMEFTLSGDAGTDTRHIMEQVNGRIERWIRDDPAQWFWVHKRWPRQ